MIMVALVSLFCGVTSEDICSEEQQTSVLVGAFDNKDELIVHEYISTNNIVDVQFNIESHDSFFIVYLEDLNFEMDISVSGVLQTPPEIIEEDPNKSPLQYQLVKPDSIKHACGSYNDCSASITLRLSPGLPCGSGKMFNLKVVRCYELEWDQMTTSSAPFMGVKRFGMSIHKSNLSALVTMTPHKGDLDLYLYNEADLFRFFFPSHDHSQRNHHSTNTERALIQHSSFSDSSSSMEFFLIYVYASEDSTNPNYAFNIHVQSVYQVPFIVTSVLSSLSGMLGSCIILVIGFVYILLHQARYSLLLGSRRGALPSELNAFPVKTFNGEFSGTCSASDAKCVICLENYNLGDLLREVACGHNFHQGCVDSWLKINKRCPLCKQDFVAATNHHKING